MPQQHVVRDCDARLVDRYGHSERKQQRRDGVDADIRESNLLIR